jgi:hypothetical protein
LSDDPVVKLSADLGPFNAAMDKAKAELQAYSLGLKPAPDYVAIDWPVVRMYERPKDSTEDPWVAARAFRSKQVQAAIAEREQHEYELAMEAYKTQRENEPFGKVYAAAYPEEQEYHGSLTYDPSVALDPSGSLFGYNLHAPARYIYPVLTAFKFTPFRNKIPRILKPPSIALPQVCLTQRANCNCLICLDPTHDPEPPKPTMTGLLDWLRDADPLPPLKLDDALKDIEKTHEFLLQQIAKTFNVDPELLRT